MKDNRNVKMEENNRSYDQGICNRLARATGHLKSIRTMVENQRDCSEVLIQLSAVKSAVSGVERIVLKQYLRQCIEEELYQKDSKGMQKLKREMDRFLK